MLRLLLSAALALAFGLPAQAQDRAPCVDGFATVPDVGAFPCDGVDLVGYVGRDRFALPGSPEDAHNDVWGWTDPETGTEYALVATENGLGFVDLSDPTAPRVVGKLPSQNGRSSTWRDVKVHADHAFVVADSSPDHGVQVFALARLRGVAGDPVLFEADAVYDGVSSAHNIVVNEETGFAYAVGFRYGRNADGTDGRVGRGLPASCDAPGLHAIDVRDPLDPTFAGCFSDIRETEEGQLIDRGYTHDAQCVVYRGPDADYQGRELCFAANENEVTVFDLTDKADPQIVSRTTYPLASYTHQGWLTADQRFFIANDETDESRNRVPTQRTVLLDLQDLDDPELLPPYVSDDTTIDHNLYVRGRYAFLSNYEAGLRVLDVSEVGTGTLQEVAFFDTYPPSTEVSFNGQWSNYPFFESGLVIANDRDYGLFVLRPDASLGVSNEDAPAPFGYALSDPAPNPTGSVARLALRVDEPQAVRAELFDVAGRRVATVFEGAAAPGRALTLTVSADGLPAGVYVLRVSGERFETARRITLAR